MHLHIRLNILFVMILQIPYQILGIKAVVMHHYGRYTVQYSKYGTSLDRLPWEV